MKTKMRGKPVSQRQLKTLRSEIKDLRRIINNIIGLMNVLVDQQYQDHSTGAESLSKTPLPHLTQDIDNVPACHPAIQEDVSNVSAIQRAISISSMEADIGNFSKNPEKDKNTNTEEVKNTVKNTPPPRSFFSIKNLLKRIQKEDEKIDTEEVVDPATAEIEYVPSPRNSIRPRRSTIGDIDDDGEITNTDTIYMYAIAMTVGPSARRLTSWLAALALLTVILSQISVIRWLVTESAFPPCHSNSDCLEGSYCGYDSTEKSSVCSDCFDQKFNSTDSKYWEDETEVIDKCYPLFPLDWWENKASINIDHNEAWVPNLGEINRDKTDCLSFIHCNNTDMDAVTNFMGHCDFIALNKSKMNRGIWFTLFFLSLIFVTPLCQDMEEAAMEEIILDYHLKDALNLPAEIVRLTLRVRQTLLPCAITGAAFALLLTDSMSAKSITLNILTVSIFSEVDNALSSLLFTKSQHNLMKQMVVDVDENISQDNRMSFFWTRMKGFLCILTLILLLSYIEDLVTNCHYLNTFIFSWFALLLPLAIAILEVVFSLIGAVRTSERNFNEKSLCVMKDFLRNLLAISSALKLSKIIENWFWSKEGTDLLPNYYGLYFSLSDNYEDNPDKSNFCSPSWSILFVFVALMLIEIWKHASLGALMKKLNIADGAYTSYLMRTLHIYKKQIINYSTNKNN